MREPMIRHAYNAALLATAAPVFGYLAWCSARERGGMGLAQRLGLSAPLPWAPRGRVWIHGASAGEVSVASPIVRQLRFHQPRLDLVLSSTTGSGRHMALSLGLQQAHLRTLPVDWPWCVSSALHRFKPSAIVLVEGEIWPNLTHLAHQLGIPVLMVNGRLSDRGMERRLRLPALSAWPLGRMDYLGMQTQVDADRVLRLGGRPECVEVVGNAKFDQELGPLPAAEVAALRESLGLGWGTRLLLAGSTHRGEESEILDAFVALSKRDQRLRLALAPRETGRIQEVQALVRSRGLSCCFRTRPLPATTLGASTVRVIDTMGELGRLYAAASLAFVGGTLVQVGGHNLLQPVAQGVPVLFGPHTGNTRDVADMLLREGVGFRVEDQSSVVAHASALLEDPGALRSLRGRCLASVERGRGASACYADRILRSLERSRDLGRSPRTQARGPAANALRDDALAR